MKHPSTLMSANMDTQKGTSTERNFKNIRMQAEQVADILEEEGVFHSDAKIAKSDREKFVWTLTTYAENMDTYPFCSVDFEQSNVTVKATLKKNVSTTGSDILITFEVSAITVRYFAKPDNVEFCQNVESIVRERLGLTDD